MSSLSSGQEKFVFFLTSNCPFTGKLDDIASWLESIMDVGVCKFLRLRTDCTPLNCLQGPDIVRSLVQFHHRLKVQLDIGCSPVIFCDLSYME